MYRELPCQAAAYATATGKAAKIRMYWTTDIAKGVREATADGCDVCSISWGAEEAKWGDADAYDMEKAAIAATAAGMVVFAAAGDNDSSDGGPTSANIDVPTSCPVAAAHRRSLDPRLYGITTLAIPAAMPEAFGEAQRH